MPIFATFVMGSKESYFFNTPTHWAWHNLPPDIEALITSTPPVKDVIEVALSENQTYFISYRDHSGQIQCKHYNLPNPLTEWLYASHPSVIRDLATLSITLGPYESYYAWEKNSASWSNLPAGLEKAVLARLESQGDGKGRTTWKSNGAEAPSFVSLGADGAYFMRTVCGGGCWDLKCGKDGDGREGLDGLRGMHKFLEECRDFNGVAGLHLFPSHPNAYILILTSGKAFSNLPECTWVDYNKVAPALPTFVQSALPMPPMPQLRSPPPQTQVQAILSPSQSLATKLQAQPVLTQMQPPQLQQSRQPPQIKRYSCCPSLSPGAVHNCCPQIPQQPRVYGLPVYGSVPYISQPNSYYQRPS